ncbi:hypothetical protein LQK89_14830 [Curtobacterium sp. C1]|uniref:Uncharacterized protein n=1 Tax=Curtobacterium citreum TaxID=2036 RepID=A0A850DWV4_9MICO|nr:MULTISPECIES: hypothetical protein [Curtobacterium]MCS5487917.1 hypothetical protein [Curtobacterium flaccumfaciens pv. basellae]MDK8172916.1 hypothetical protein [Curtobacterium citreum]NUU29259.1 hypothetical protein [Curtobacterium albidum]QKS13143.1 hypothetical protein HUN60_08320 [Curtobacterium sp. csp3]QKS15267.1 hypothetical protein HUN59_02770 [Curtobacterium sp. Csp2]
MADGKPVVTRRKRVVAIAILLLVIVIPALLFFVIPLGMKVYDDGHRMSVSCGIRSATTGSESSGSLKGGGASGSQVVVVTDQCGKILLQDGVNRFNADRIAGELSGADRVRFTVGAASYDMRAVTAVFGVSPTAYAYEVEPRG